MQDDFWWHILVYSDRRAGYLPLSMKYVTSVRNGESKGPVGTCALQILLIGTDSASNKLTTGVVVKRLQVARERVERRGDGDEDDQQQSYYCTG